MADRVQLTKRQIEVLEIAKHLMGSMMGASVSLGKTGPADTREHAILAVHGAEELLMLVQQMSRK